jgi:hypothetical protein
VFVKVRADDGGYIRAEEQEVDNNVQKLCISHCEQELEKEEDGTRTLSQIPSLQESAMVG